MTEANPQSDRIECPCCGGQFRLHPEQGHSLPASVSCPICPGRIPVGPSRRHRRWVETTYAEVFDRAPRPVPIDTEPPPTPEAEEPSQAGPSRTPPGPSQTSGARAEQNTQTAVGVSIWWVLLGIMLGGGAAAAGIFVWMNPTGDPTPRAQATEPTPTPDTGASKSVGAASSPPKDAKPPSPEDVRAAVDAAKKQVQSAPDALGYVGALLEVDHYRPARTRALDLLTAAGTGSNPEAARLYRRSIRQDPAFDRRVLTLGEDVDIGAVHSLGGGWSISFRLTYRGRTRYAFKPMQKNWTEGWRAEIASDRLCQVLPCGFKIPRNRPARIRRDRFERLYRKVWDEDQKEYAERFDDLVWTTEVDDDGEQHEYLYGTLKDWVPDFVRWPLEYSTVWEPWLDARQPVSVLEQPLEEALAPFKEKGSVPFYRRIIDERGDATTRSIARQLSNILVFDFLVSNWDRFSTATQYYGVNNQFADGRFVSIDNGAAFPTIHFPDVRNRLSPVSRFSRRMIAAVRALEPETLNPVLFPDPSIDERARLEVFWSQRDRLLDRMRTLVATHGRDAVYAFE